jgi:hypothetical protein
MTTEKDERWLDVLAGKTQADDAQTRQASALRGYFELQEQQTPALDEAAQRRIMNTLHAKGVFAQAAAPKPVQRPGLLGQALAWLFPQGHASGGRFAGVAAAVLAVVMLPILLHSPSGDDDPGGIKSFRPPVATATAVVDSANPEQMATQLVARLARLGVTATLRRDGADRWVQAQVSPERMSAVQTELVGMGLAAAQDGQLAVQFRQQP